MEKSASISVETGRRVCINCKAYRQYYQIGDGNVWSMRPVGAGYCTKYGQQRGPLRKACKEFRR